MRSSRNPVHEVPRAGFLPLADQIGNTFRKHLGDSEPFVRQLWGVSRWGAIAPLTFGYLPKRFICCFFAQRSGVH